MIDKPLSRAAISKAFEVQFCRTTENDMGVEPMGLAARSDGQLWVLGYAWQDVELGSNFPMSNQGYLAVRLDSSLNVQAAFAVSPPSAL